jgi:hypothetical protein
MSGEVRQADCFLRQALARHEQPRRSLTMIRAKPARETGGCRSRSMAEAFMAGN